MMAEYRKEKIVGTENIDVIVIGNEHISAGGKTDSMPELRTARDLDKFYTVPSLASELVDTACDILQVNRNEHMFVEPSAGSGAFSNAVPHVMAYDLKPEGENIKQADFLSLEPEWDREAVAIGNPPFGKKARLAVDFLNRCGQNCDAVCFILPNTFRRYNTQSSVDEELALVYDRDLSEHGSFTYLGSPYSLRCIFQVWVRKDGSLWKNDMQDIRQRKRPPIRHEDFNCWQHNATEQSRKYLDENWKYAFWRQGYKDYSRVFTKENDYDEVRSIMYDTNLQLFLVEPLTKEAEQIILSMDLESLARQNLSTPGFGKADFVGEYERVKRLRAQS